MVISLAANTPMIKFIIRPVISVKPKECMGKADRVAVFYVEEWCLHAFRSGIGCREAAADGVCFLIWLCDRKDSFVNLPCLNLERLAAALA